MNYIKKILSKLGKTSTPNLTLDAHGHLAMIDRERHNELRERFGDVAPYPGFSKYLDADKYIDTALIHYRLSGLADIKGQNVLDIGTGAGYFPFVCTNLGHSVTAIDVPSHDFYKEMTSLLGIQRIEHRVEPFTPLPAFGQRFDFVTAFAICFNGHATDSLWGREEWAWFIEDLQTNHLNPNSTIFLKLNQEPDGTFMTEALREYFVSQGSEIDADMVRITRKESHS